MSKRNVAMVAAAGAAVITAGLYGTGNRKGAESQGEPSRHRAQAKRDLGLGGAGVGGNQMVGSTELGASAGRPDNDPEGKQVTTAASRSELPSGGVGGGEGAGKTNARSIELPTGSKSVGTSAAGTNKKVSLSRFAVNTLGLLTYCRAELRRGDVF